MSVLLQSLLIRCLGFLALGSYMGVQIRAHEFDRRWSRTLDPGSAQRWNRTPPVSPDGRVFLNSIQGAVVAVNTSDGMDVWRRELGSLTGEEALLTPDGLLVLGSSHGNFAQLVALNSSDGATVWTREFDGLLASSVAYAPDGTLYAATHRGVHAVRASDGGVLWSTTFDSPGLLQISQLAVGHGAVVAYEDGSDSGYPIHAYDAGSGEHWWSTKGVGPFGAIPMSDGSFLAGQRIQGSPRGVCVLDGSSGRRLWTRTQVDAYYNASPVLASDTAAFVAAYYGFLLRVRTDERSLQTAFSPGWWARPSAVTAMADGSLYVLHSEDSSVSVALDHIQFTNGVNSPGTGVNSTRLAGISEGSGMVVAPDGTLILVGYDGSLLALAGSGPLADTHWPKARGGPGNTAYEPSFYRGEPRIIRPLTNRTCIAGTPVTLGNSIGGLLPLAVQWFKDGEPLPLSDGFRWHIPACSPGDAGEYHFIARNAEGSVTSAPIHLQIQIRLQLGVEGGGDVRQQPPGTLFTPGTVVELEAIPHGGTSFLGWEGSRSFSGSHWSLTLDESLKLLARFTPAPGSRKFVTDFGLDSRQEWSIPAIGTDGTVYRLFGYTVQAIDGQTGAIRWTYLSSKYLDTDTDPVITGDGALLFVTGSPWELVCLDLATRAVRWTAPFRGPLTLGDTLYAFQDTDDFPAQQMFGLRPENGIPLWKAAAKLRFPEESLLVGSDLYVGYRYHFDGGDGRLLQLRSQDDPHLSAVGIDGNLFGWTRAAVQGYVGVDSRTGEIKWQRRIGGQWAEAPRMILGPDNVVYGSNNNGLFGAVDGFTGALRWSVRLTGRITRAGALASDGTVYAVTSSEVAAMDSRDGAILWRTGTTNAFGETMGSNTTDLTLGEDGTLYVGTDYGLMALHGTAPLAKAPWPKHRADLRNSGRRADFPPVMRRSPVTSMHLVGSGVDLQVEAFSQPRAVITWYFEDRPLDGTDGVFQIPQLAGTHAGTYRATISNYLGTIQVPPFRLLVADLQGEEDLRLRVQAETSGEAFLETADSLSGPWVEIEHLRLKAGANDWSGGESTQSRYGFYRLRLANGPAPAITAQRGLRVSIPGRAGARRRIEYVDAGTGWENWQVLTNLTLTSDRTVLEDPNPGAFRPRFYRAVAAD